MQTYTKLREKILSNPADFIHCTSKSEIIVIEFFKFFPFTFMCLEFWPFPKILVTGENNFAF